MPETAKVETPEAVEAVETEAVETEAVEIDDTQAKAAYDLMRKKGYSNEEKFAEAIENGSVDLSDVEGSEEFSDETRDTVQEPKKQATDQKGEESDTTQSGKPVEEKVDAQKYKTLQGILDARNREFSSLQQRWAHMEPYLRNLNDPQFQQHVLSYNQGGTPLPQQQPVNDEEYMTVGDFRRMQQQEQQQRTMMSKVQKTAEFQQNFNRATAQNRNELINTGIAPAEVDKAMQDFQAAFMSGNVYKLAHRASAFDKAVEEAEKRGRESALKEMKAGGAKRTPRTVGTQSTKVSHVEKAEWDELGPAELEAVAKTIDPGTDPTKFEQFTRWLEKKAKQKY